MAALREHRAPLTDAPAVYKVHKKNRLVLISETETGTNDRICLTVGLLWLVAELTAQRESICPNLLLPLSSLASVSALSFLGGRLQSLRRRVVEASIWACLMGEGERENRWCGSPSESKGKKTSDGHNTLTASSLHCLKQTFPRLFPVPLGHGRSDPRSLQERALLPTAASRHI